MFLVAEVDRSGNAFWLGDSEQYRFHRGTSGQYAYNNANVLIRPDKGGTIRCNGDSVSDALNTYPEMPGGLSVYVFTTSSNARWGRLGLDRSQTYRHGGKRVAELISFGTALSDENRATIEKMLMEKWRPSEEYVDSVVAGAAVHVDASSAANFNYTDGNITGWKNAGTGADLYRPEAQYSGSGAATAAPYEPGYGAYGYTNGVPAFLMGGRASGIDLMFERLTNVRSVFWVMDINPNTDSFFLNDATTAESTSADYHFHRGYSGGVVGYYAHSSYGAAFINAITRCDRAAVAATAERPPFGTHVYDLVTKQDYTASSLSKDRYITDRSGDRAISELLIFTNAVAGLTRDAISERLQSRWTKRCGWAGAGDAEWGEGKYRVFDADATIPAGGATADGVGFTASATLSGGTLTLGDGGVFASEGATATVSAPVAGKVAAYGPGTVAFAEPLDGADSVTAGRGATLVLKPNGTVTGALTILSDANVEIDVSSLAAGEHATIAFGSLYIEDGRAFEECVTLVGAEGHVLSLSADGRTLHVNDPGVPITAVWNGGASVADAANWTCRNIQGGIVSDALPGTLTTNVTLTAALDLRGQGTALALASDAACDLGGNELAVSGLDAASVPFAKIGNSAAGAAAVLRVEVASGAVTTNSAVALAGNLRLVKCGLGGLFLAKTGQTYTGGTEVTEGTLTTLNYSTHDARWHPLGANGSVITVTTNGANRGVMNLDGLYAECNAYYSFVLNGGLLENIGTDVNNSYGQIPSITLGADSEISVTNSFGMWNGEGTTKIADLDLGGHVLTVGIADGKDLLLNAVRVSSGTLAATATGSTGHLFLDDCNNRILMATNATFLIDCGIASTAAAAGLAVDVGDYHALYAGDFNTGDHPFSVFGTFKPSAHDLYRGCTMQNGSTIDLSSRTNALPAVSAFATGANALAFAEGATVAVKLGSRRVSSRTPVISWNQEEPPENIGTVSFIGGDEGRSRRFIKKADGLYITGGLILFVK